MDQTPDNDIKAITTPQQAVEQFVGEQFIEWAMNYVAHEISNMSALDLIRNSHPKIEKLRKFMTQQFVADAAFIGAHNQDPGFLGFAIANLSEADDPEAESALGILAQYRDEELINYDQKWSRLLRALGITEEEITRVEPKEAVRMYTSELSDLYSNGQWQEVAGAFAAHKQATALEFSMILALVQANMQISNSDLEVLNAGAKQASFGLILEKIVFDDDNKQLIWQGVTRTLAAHNDFYTALIKYLEI